MIECEYCNAKFKIVSKYNTHINKMICRQKYICVCCNIEFKKKYNLKIHMSRKSSKSSINISDNIFSHPKNLESYNSDLKFSQFNNSTIKIETYIKRHFFYH